MDYRLVTDVAKHMIAEGYDDNYDHDSDGFDDDGGDSDSDFA